MSVEYQILIYRTILRYTLTTSTYALQCRLNCCNLIVNNTNLTKTIAILATINNNFSDVSNLYTFFCIR